MLSIIVGFLIITFLHIIALEIGYTVEYDHGNGVFRVSNSQAHLYIILFVADLMIVIVFMVYPILKLNIFD